jgi:hypothetical protein
MIGLNPELVISIDYFDAEEAVVQLLEALPDNKM